jgi:hypothetical protein
MYTVAPVVEVVAFALNAPATGSVTVAATEEISPAVNSR